MAKRRGSGDGSIFKDGDRWVAVVTLPSTGGRQVRRKRMARTYSEARTKLRDLQEELRVGVVGAGRLDVEAYLTDWLANVLPARGISVATAENYATMIRIHIVPAIGSIRLDQLRAEHVDEMLRGMAEDGKARSTIRLPRTVLVLALTHAERRDMVARNAARLAVVPPAPVRESRSLTLDQAKALLNAIRGDRLEAAWVVGLLLGLRPGETFALRWEDIDFEAGTLSVRQAIKRAGGASFVLGEPKTATSRRTLAMAPMVAEVAEAFKAHRARQAAERLAAGECWQDSGLVFTTAIGTMIDPANSRRAFAKLTEGVKLADDAKLGRWHPHELRHSMVSLLSASGVAPEDVADLAGHRPGSKMTGDVYRHRVSESVGAGAAKVMEQLFGAPSTAP